MSKRKDDNNNDEATTPKKPAIYKQTFLDSYTTQWPFLIRSTKSDYHARCTVCDKDISCANGGRDDLRRHVKSVSHGDYAKLKSNNRTIQSFCKTPSETEKDLARKVVKAEAFQCSLIANLNLSLSSADTLGKTFKQMFPDSKIAAEMKCGRNKTTAVVGELALIAQEDLVTRMRQRPFTISTDGSNDNVSKQFPMVVRTVNLQTGKVDSELLSISICEESATGENIFLLIDKELKKREIPWKNNLALGCDNASTMTGKKKGVIAYARNEHPDIFLAGCTLHLVHIAAKKAASILPPVDEALTDIYYYFNKSDVRKQEFRGTQELYDVEQKKNLKHVCTRWLSIGRCVERLLLNWDPLKDYFYTQKKKMDESKSKKEKKAASDESKKSTDKSNAKPRESKKSTETSDYCTQSYAERKIEAIYDFIRSPTNKLYMVFLNYTVHVFDDVLKNLQTEDPMIHVLRRVLQKLLRNVMTRFVKPSAFTSAPSIESVDYKSKYNQKVDQELVIGDDATEFIKNKDKNHLRDKKISEFYLTVRRYFISCCDYMIEKLPLKDELLRHAEIVDVECQQSSKSASLKYFLERFPALLPKGVTKDIVIEQFVSYQMSDVKDCKNNRIDETWMAIGKLKEHDQLLFHELAVVMCGILTIPHSSAHCERVFSCVRKNRTEQRSCLGDNTLESLLVLKSSNVDINSLDGKSLDRLKGAYYRKLHQ